MFGKNNIQKSFKKQMKELEKELKTKEKENSGVFTNSLFKQRFYGYNYGSSDISLGRRIIGVSFAVLGAFFILLVCAGILMAILNPEDLNEKIVESYDKGDLYYTIDYCDRALSKDSNNYTALLYKAKAFMEWEVYEEALVCFREAENVNNLDQELFLESGYANYLMEKYNESLRCYNRAIEIDPESSEAYLWKGYVCNELGEYEEAVMSLDSLLTLDPGNADGYNTKGIAMSCLEEYTQAIGCFDKAIEAYKGGKFEEAHINKIEVLYYMKDYIECINYCKDMQKEFKYNWSIPYYTGCSYSKMGQHEEAVKYYEQALKINPGDDSIIAIIADEYFYLQDYEKASEYAQKALKLNTENAGAIRLVKNLEDVKRPESERIVDFIRKNYLYLDKIEGFEDKAKVFTNKKQVNMEQIYTFLESVKLEDDIYTFMVFDDYYNELMNEGERDSIEYKTLGENCQYIRIPSFTESIANEFRNTISSIIFPEEQVLVIDLRDNPGGLAVPANNMLDVLLPGCITNYMVTRDGEISSYSSDKSQIKFKKIYLFVNENSASSSELFALGLKKYLNNVTIIGKATAGKGVGQCTFENKQKKYMIFLVNCYWNVKEKNIMGEKIYPDVVVNGNDLSDYIDSMASESGDGSLTH